MSGAVAAVFWVLLSCAVADIANCAQYFANWLGLYLGEKSTLDCWNAQLNSLAQSAAIAAYMAFGATLPLAVDPFHSALGANSVYHQCIVLR
jgi:hypothetical protein